MHSGSNYEKLRSRAKEIFASLHPEEVRERLSLEGEGGDICLNFLSSPVRLSGIDHEIRRPDGSRVPFSAAMTIYDMLGHRKETPLLAGRFVTLTALGGHIAAGHAQSLQPLGMPEAFAGRGKALDAACRLLGGKKEGPGDVSYRLPLFDFFPIGFQFWDGDDEFPPSLSFQWDAAALSFLHYETLWYAMEAVRDRLLELMNEMERASASSSSSKE